MSKKEKRNHRFEVRLTEQEANQLLEISKSYKTPSEFIRARIFRSGSQIVDPKELIRSVDEVTASMNRIGNNINQFAKYANQRRGIDNDSIMKEYTSLLGAYIQEEKKLEILYRKIMAL